jgi:hypothetical protein
MQGINVHPEEVRRVAELGDLPETRGQEIVVALQSMQPANWYTNDLDDPRYLVTNIAHAPAIEMERRVAAGIGSTGPSLYERLFVGCTDVDAPTDSDIIHVNSTPEDMRFAAGGPRILIDGRIIPVPDDFFRHSEGSHIPFDLGCTPVLIRELFRTLRPGGTLRYAPSTNTQNVGSLLTAAGFPRVVIVGLALITPYRGRNTLPAPILQATKP